jgi:tetratricopeptide (TPR) repeat protein
MAELGRLLLAAGYPPGRVKVLAQSPTAGADAVPSAGRIRQEVEGLVKDCLPGDTLLLALAGPVVAAPGGTESYFCPAGADLSRPATLVPLAWIFQQLAACPAGTKFVLIDGSRNGGGAALPARPEAAKLEDQIPGGLSVLLSSAGGQVGYVHAEERHGAFWSAVLRGLQGAARTKEGKVTVGSLAEYAAKATRDHVAEAYKAAQTPVLVVPTRNATAAVVAIPDPALQCLHDGDELLKKKEYAKAADQYSQAIALRKDLVEAYLRRAEANYRLENYDGTIADCTEALQLDPGNASAIDFRGDGHFGKAGKVMDGMNKGEMTLAIQDYSAAIDADPDYAPTYNSRGSARGSLALAYGRKDAEKSRAEDELAVADIGKAIELAPRASWEYFENRGRAYRRLGKANLAADDYSAALTTGETIPPDRLYVIRYNRGRAYLSLKDYERAEADFDAAARLKPDKPDPYLMRAQALDALNRKEEARQAREKAAALKRSAPPKAG